MKFNKSPTTFQQQIALLESRGLIIKDSKKALQNISRINYYRLSSYYPPFQSQKNLFKQGIFIERIFELYEFDRKLRSLIFSALENVEITLRTKIAYYFSHQYGPFAYIEPHNFSYDFKHREWCDKLKESIEKTHEKFVKDFFSEYNEEKTLPLWIAIEIISFGQLSILFRGLMRRDRKKISKDCFGIDEKTLVSWVHTLAYVRNLCAHHCRIWNRTLSISPKISRGLNEWIGISNSKIFCVFMIFKKLIIIPGQWETFKNNLIQLLKEHDDVDIKRMGFPDDWEDRINSI